MKSVDLFRSYSHDNSVIARPQNSNNCVKECFMERLILNKLLERKNSPYRKPLILKGVRQMGKTWILKEFGKRYYENWNTVSLTFV